jgi:hypothetical protein
MRSVHCVYEKRDGSQFGSVLAARPFSFIVLVALTHILGVGVNIGCGVTGGACPDVTTTVTVSGMDARGAGDGGTNDLVARCQASSSDCLPLCQHFVPYVKSCQRLTVDGGGLAVRVVSPGGCE